MSGAGLSSVANAIVGSMGKWERKPADFYPTPSDVTYSLFPHIVDLLPEGSRVVEPACGDGAMARALEECGYDVHACDLREDSGYGQGGVDFLSIDFSNQGFDAIITNPPFNISDKFISHGVNQTRIFALLLKSQYWHAAKRLKLFEMHPPARILPLTWRPSFLEKERGKSPLMDVLWVIWDRNHSGATIYKPISRVVEPPLTATFNFDSIFD